MPCLGTMISFGKLKLTQIYCLANKKFLNLNLDQIPPLFLKLHSKYTAIWRQRVLSITLSQNTFGDKIGDKTFCR